MSLSGTSTLESRAQEHWSRNTLAGCGTKKKGEENGVPGARDITSDFLKSLLYECQHLSVENGVVCQYHSPRSYSLKQYKAILAAGLSPRQIDIDPLDAATEQRLEAEGNEGRSDDQRDIQTHTN
jgi:hypothetical protein